VLALGPPAPTRAAPAGASTTPAAGAGSAPVDAPRPVSGGGGFADAPLLGAGIYRDTLLPRETLFYAVSLQAGQRLRIRATIDLSVGSRSIQDIPDAAGGFPTITLFTPLRQQLPGIDLDPDDGGGLESVAVTAASPRVLSAAAANRRAAENEPWTGPGTYHFAIVLSQITRDLGATVELPFAPCDRDRRSAAVRRAGHPCATGTARRSSWRAALRRRRAAGGRRQAGDRWAARPRAARRRGCRRPGGRRSAGIRHRGSPAKTLKPGVPHRRRHAHGQRVRNRLCGLGGWDTLWSRDNIQGTDTADGSIRVDSASLDSMDVRVSCDA
jgi:hypothetical protein